MICDMKIVFRIPNLAMIAFEQTETKDGNQKLYEPAKIGCYKTLEFPTKWRRLDKGP
jgi:hypothetical protein